MIDEKAPALITTSELRCPVCGRNDQLESVEKMTILYELDVYGDGKCFEYADSQNIYESAEPDAPEGHMRIWCSVDNVEFFFNTEGSTT